MCHVVSPCDTMAGRTDKSKSKLTSPIPRHLFRKNILAKQKSAGWSLLSCRCPVVSPCVGATHPIVSYVSLSARWCVCHHALDRAISVPRHFRASLAGLWQVLRHLGSPMLTPWQSFRDTMAGNLTRMADLGRFGGGFRLRHGC